MPFATFASLIAIVIAAAGATITIATLSGTLAWLSLAAVIAAALIRFRR